MSEIETKTGIPTAEKHKDNPDRLPKALEAYGFDNLSPEERLSVIEQARPEDFKGAVIALHRLVAPEADPEPTGRQMKLVGGNGEVRHLAAQPDQRDKILGLALDKAKAVAAKYRREGGSIQDVLNRCGNLAAFGVTLAHLFEDGSGRTARVLGHLIRESYQQDEHSKADLAVLGANRPPSGFRINSYVPKVDWANDDPARFLDTVAALDVPFDGSSYKTAAGDSFMTPYGH
ncbi:MAG: hypothetical protein EOT04_02845 [Candidatus Chaera renei]|uniref:Uncharacterized protein n=1 Tax=Candidatus Chaera renei TaxID=2506947 RepID=A0A4Q0AGD4_9BACT|nr:MAG: hypothetical protein EOT04_02845 [Candidatus Chaera renei]